MEWVVAGSLVATNIFYLLIRSCFRNKNFFHIKTYFDAQTKANTETDFMQSQVIALGIFQVFFVPLLCSLTFLVDENISSSEKGQLIFILVVSLVQSVLYMLYVYGGSEKTLKGWKARACKYIEFALKYIVVPLSLLLALV